MLPSKSILLKISGLYMYMFLRNNVFFYIERIAALAISFF